MIILGDFWNGFLKPLRDLSSALVAYLIFTSGRTVTSTIQNSEFSFNIWGFFAFYVVISWAWEFFLAAKYDFTRGYKDPIDSSFRMVGVFTGTLIFSFILIPIYYNIGGDVGDILTSEIIAAIFTIAGMMFRLYILQKPHYY